STIAPWAKIRTKIAERPESETCYFVRSFDNLHAGSARSTVTEFTKLIDDNIAARECRTFGRLAIEVHIAGNAIMRDIWNDKAVLFSAMPEFDSASWFGRVHLLITNSVASLSL